MVVLMVSYFIRVMDPNSSLGKIYLGENVVEISSDKINGSGDRDSPEYQDTANSGGKKETKAMVFHKMDTEELVIDSWLLVLSMGWKHMMGKLILEWKRTCSRTYTQSFLRMTKAITDFGAGTITIYPDIDPFLEDTEEEEKSMDY
ncbi:hypothetical protein Tco_1256738 [Tanacetum coccineum]